MTAPDKPRLSAARPTGVDEAEGYRPRLPWRVILLGALSIATVLGGYVFNERRKAEQLAAQLVRVHEQELAEPARRYRELRTKLEDWIMQAAAQRPDNFADPRLRISGLRTGKGLYLRIPAQKATTRKDIAAAARTMEGDGIAACLGMAPASARGLFERGEFLLPEWLAKQRKDPSVMNLRVADTMLARHIKVDLPNVLNLLRSDWFLLVLEQGDNRFDHPVDVHLWDMRRSEPLLRGRVQASGALFGVRVRSKDAPPSPRLAPDRLKDAAAQDCSIAAQIKQLAGVPLTTVENVPEPSATSTPAPTQAPAAAPSAAQPAP